ncbi:hypothetical protein CH298_27975 [Rhodococcoides fascians]|uniref:oligopeptide/dipeptide ABC transporter ATP-binding protein n=1 Tax=Rhodococcoides fascians TaxID=1828 RepID=UPI000B9AAD9A|nr:MULTISPECIES: oligopeptide/dipeptide ABC transporter ATP-binding protein [Rhodococcus]OZD69002.1 hypothetical protein CH263_08990 [Rhodococcus sp. 06-1059B-a]OZE81323.1 hypothetical protein CH303_27730 [Rhodococcus fascians]OZF08510.1 hypothetical protein CH298_27975 [Rhodococcus fascians]OZF10925.1 hypothetical protein CH297_28155 [Rhodococcus fascians]OZF59108.1 hypothetical protein CH308_27995 [Rhodococcus fascians]
MTSSTAAIDVRHIEVAFRQKRRDPWFLALDDVSVQVRGGRTVGIVGESGSGKSTLAKAVLGLVPVRSGSITVGGTDVTGGQGLNRKHLAANLQAVFQDPTGSLNPSYTVGKSLAEPIRAQGVRAKDVGERVAHSLEMVGLDPSAAQRLPREFSGGQRQRICIARALMTSPRFLICDEAVSALDLSVQAQILNLLMDLQEQAGLAYLFISHDMNVVKKICHDVTVLYRGRSMESGPTEIVTATPAHPYTRALLLASPVADPAAQAARHASVSSVNGVAAQPSSGSGQGCVFAARCPFADTRCTSDTPQLRDVGGGVSVACHRYPDWTYEVQNEHSPTTAAGRHRTAPSL